ncbi:hypothetical protein T484DRAFT_3040432 [Baffinella frigidus]|nr:hypothetical protein T484DRAFT_3040432 [Cryptophyta sp. CCMP2293]
MQALDDGTRLVRRLSGDPAVALPEGKQRARLKSTAQTSSSGRTRRKSLSVSPERIASGMSRRTSSSSRGSAASTSTGPPPPPRRPANAMRKVYDVNTDQHGPPPPALERPQIMRPPTEWARDATVTGELTPRPNSSDSQMEAREKYDHLEQRREVACRTVPYTGTGLPWTLTLHLKPKGGTLDPKPETRNPEP